MIGRWLFGLVCVAAAWVFAAGLAVDAAQQAAPPPPVRTAATSPGAVLTQYCAGCHNARTQAGGLALNPDEIARAGSQPDVWEKVVRKLRARMMPPAGLPRPDEATYTSIVARLESTLDQAAAAAPNPGRVDTFRRLTQTEYQNAIRDLLGLDVDVRSLLPRDDASYGFDNVGVGGLSPTLLERYLAAAQKISRLAVGSPVRAPSTTVAVVPADLTQEGHLEGLPLGTRGGTVVRHTFPTDGDYEIQILLQRDRNENVEGLTEPNAVELTLDGARVELFTVSPKRNQMGVYYADESVDKHLKIRIPVAAGPHTLGVVFPRKTSALLETERQPYQAFFNMDRHPRIQPAVRSVSITGPFDARSTAADTPSRQRIFLCRPVNTSQEAACAKTIISTLARRAYRRPVTDADIQMPLASYTEARAEAGFEAGIELALRTVLASTEFLFRIEREPVSRNASAASPGRSVAPNTSYRISDVELASRLSFFLWSSIPDDELLDLASRNRLRDRATLRRQVDRMLADARSDALVTSFAGQWLYLRNLAAATPDARLFPDFDDNLRQSFRQETELLFDSIVHENRSVLDLLRATYTFLDERLAKHYGIPGVYGSRFRRVELAPDSIRRGLLGHGSILTITSYANRTSPVLRGKWVLENILGAPPPPPPENVPPLDERRTEGKAPSMRERMLQHRVNPACASCHQLMDPIGLSMEHFDAIGRWRTRSEAGTPIDAAGGLPGGSSFDGVAGLRQAVLARPELFATTMTEKLLTYALGRGLEYYDAPAVRAITRDARAEEYRFASLILGIVESTPFQMRRTQ
jgi:mono/diheme cytochrome c family protein